MRNTTPRLLVVFIVGLLAAVGAPSQTVDLENLAPHPRLLLSADRLEALQEQAPDDPALSRMVRELLDSADEILEAEPLVHELKGPRLLHVSRDCLRRVYTLALAWRWTGEEVYAEGALANLETVCAFPDWNPSHFLDTAEMSHAVAIGYDWLYDYLDDASRERIRQGLIKHGLKPGVAAYTEEHPWWINSAFNWNQVCNSGLLIGALALAETDPTYTEVIVPAAVASLPKALESYNPDGVWSEGPAYWGYATRYTAYGLAALQSALGTTFELGALPGLTKTAYFPLLTAGPTGLYMNFADSRQNSLRKPLPTLFWLAETYGLADVAWAEHQVLKEQVSKPHHIIWYVPEPSSGATLPLDNYFESSVPVAVSRSAWDDPEALFLAMKGGYNQVNHGHLDLGNFEFDALGNRWARDLGSDNYNLPGYWDKKKGGKRWQYYRLNSESHNVPLVDGQGQDPNAKAKILRVGATDAGAFLVVDLSSAYPDSTERVIRGGKTIAGRRGAVIQDEFTLTRPVPLLWGMTTDAEIMIMPDGHAVLLQNGERLHVTLTGPPGAHFSVESAERTGEEHANRGVRRLVVRVPAGETDVRLSLCLRPAWGDQGPVPLPEVVPLADWK